MSRVILVTGANTGIGYELVKLLSKAGHKVYLGARNLEAGNTALETLTAEGFSNIHVLRLDVTDPSTIEAAKSQIEQTDGKLDTLVNNAGTGELGRPQRSTDIALLDVLQTTNNVNLFGLIQNTIAFLPLIRKSTLNGVIVNVTSDMASNALMAGPNPILPQAAAYNISKAAANSYTIHLAWELKEDGSGIKVNAVTPGFTSTKLNFFGAGGHSAQHGAEIILPWALLGADGPTGLFIDQNGKETAW